jgi:two-component system, OmpR family, response regulator ChvI
LLNIETTSAKLSSTSSTGSHKRNNNRILLVDDEIDIASLFKLALESSGLVVDLYNDPLTALLNYKADMYDLLLLDIRMPGMSGFQLYQKIKDVDSKVQVCFITAYDEYLRELKKLYPSLEEVDCFLRKPIELDRLIKIVKSRLRLD